MSSEDRIPPGSHVLSVEVVVDEQNKPGVGGKAILHMGDTVIEEGRFEKQVPYRFTVNEGFDVGCDTVSPVSDQYESPFPFTGKIKRLVIDISKESLADLSEEAKAARAKIMMGMQ